jgi:cell division protein FtsQ
MIGNISVTNDTIISEAGLTLEDNLLGIRSKNLKEKLESIPYVKEVKIRKKLPDTIEIQIIERKAYLQFENGYSYAVVDMEGILLENSILKYPDIGIVNGVEWVYTKDGESILEKEPGQLIKDLLNDLEMVSIVFKIKEISSEDDSNIKIILFNGITVEFGPMNNVKYKLKVLEEILADVEKKNIPTRMILMNKGEHPILVRDDK